ncbi:MAG: hypothetical protein FH756_10940 [Firmicutes bacterium]|nr:hypothetical protein [Bacillota bacterium]
MSSKQKKIITHLVLVLFLSFLITPIAFGETGSLPIEDEGGMFERAVAGLINALVSVIESLQTLGKLKPMDQLIFNTNEDTGPFNNHEWDLLGSWYFGVSSFVMILALVAVVATAFKMMTAAMNPLLRSEATGSMWRWFLALFIIPGAPVFVWLCFVFNAWLIDGFIWVSEKVATDVSTLGSFSMGSDFIQSIRTGSILGTAVVKLAFAGLNLYLNILYIVRFYVLVVLFVFAPIMAWMWALNKNVHASAVWIGEILSNTFMQASHALTVLVFLTFTDKGTMGDNWLTLIIGLLVILPITEMIRNSMQGLFARWAGVNEEKWAGRAMLGMTGLGAIAGLGNVGKATLGGFAGASASSGLSPGSMPGSSGATGGIQSSSGCITSASASPQPNIGNTATMGSTTYSQNPSGIFVPGNSTNNTTNQNNNQDQSKVPGITKTSSGQTSNNVGSKIGGAIGGAMGVTMMGRGGEKFARGGAAIGGALARGTTSSAKLGKEVYSQVKQGNSVGGAMKNITGGQSAAQSMGRAASFVGTQTFTPNQTRNLVNNWVTKDNPDGFRYR